MTNILTNSAALKSLYHLNKNEGASAQATERLASGQRINKAGDDAAGAAIVNRMTSQISGMEVAIRNAGDAISMAQVAEGALNEVSEILQRMRELGVQSANGTYSGADRQSINAEIVQLKKELIRIGESTTFNNTKLLNGTFQDTEFELGFDESPQHTHTLTIDDVRPSQLGVWNMSSQLEKSVTVASVEKHDGAGASEITLSTSHGFTAGDQVTYKQAGTGIPGLVDGRTYEVAASPTPTDKMFALVEADAGRDGAGTAINYGSLGSKFTGAGDTFALASLAGAPSVGVAGSDAPANESDITEDIKVYGYVGTETISYPTKSTSREIAEAVNAKSGTTGVSAYAETNARITVTPSNATDVDGTTIISFKLSGMNTTPKVISSTIKFGTGESPSKLYSPDLSDLRDKINGYSGDTGISATLSYDKTYIDIKSPDGYDIVIDDFDMPANPTTAKTQFTIAHNESTADDGSAAFGGSTNSTSFTTTGGVTHFTKASHGLQVGDMVRLSNIGNSNSIADGVGSNLDLNKLYFVKAVTANSFVLALNSHTATGFDITTGGAVANDPKYSFTFQKVEKSLNFQTLDRDGNLKGSAVTLQDQDLGDNETPDVTSSARLSGQIVYESPNVFTINTGSGTSGTLTTGNKTIFRDAPPSATLLKISDIDVLTVVNSQRMLSAVDGALRRIDAERGDLGATMNRMEHTIDNLSNIVMNTKVSKGRKADADMATESIELSKSRILQQAATSMLAQANKSMQSVLELLQ